MCLYRIAVTQFGIHFNKVLESKNSNFVFKKKVIFEGSGPQYLKSIFGKIEILVSK